ncbi:M1-specific T cell receptor beta chain-like [Hypanus sabinus]|uniref:M1-specific T cell receptor beta chain-like n=1 Tax=Hypanus sabinus TaxID=79690 RepID=UPI0028C3C85C|nr:M1-specific T cell receptor beta chain-like [Hypanus sabinus]
MSEIFTVSFMAFMTITLLTVNVTASEVSQLPKDQNVLRGANVTLFCIFPRSQDTADVRWWRDGDKTFLKNDSRRHLTVETGRGALVLWNVTFADSGMYYCEAKYQERSYGRGSGSRLTVFVPPTPLEIVPVGGFSSPRKLLCKTAAFYPEKLEIVWQRNKKRIHMGIETVPNSYVDGMYEASSLLEITQSTWGKDIYTCLVSHVSLTAPVSFSYILEQGADTRLILACALGGSAILNVILIIVLLKFKLKRSHGGNKNSLDGCQNEDPAEQAPVEHTTAYASLNHRESKPFIKDGQHEERVIYSQAKGNGADKLTYAALQIPDSSYTQASKHQSKHTLYADVNTSKELCS